jgi:hypothetical protein
MSDAELKKVAKFRSVSLLSVFVVVSVVVVVVSVVLNTHINYSRVVYQRSHGAAAPRKLKNTLTSNASPA